MDFLYSGLRFILNPRLLLPFFVLGIIAKLFGGWLVSRRVLPSQAMYKPDSEADLAKRLLEPTPPNVKVQYQYVISDGYKLDTIEVSNIKATVNSPHIIIFCGNFFSYKELKSNLIKWGNENEWKIIGYDYPGVRNSQGRLFSQEALIKSGITQVSRLIQSGVHPENITLYGMSLGGAIATIVAAHFHGLKNPQKVYLINDRSFSSISNMTIHLYGYGIRAIKYLAKPLLFFLHWDLNAKEAYSRIPEKYKILFVAKEDPRIPYATASLYQDIKSDLKERHKLVKDSYKTITRMYKISNGKSLETSQLVFQESFQHLSGMLEPGDFVHCAPLQYLKNKHNHSLEETVQKFIHRNLKFPDDHRSEEGSTKSERLSPSQ